MYTSIFSIIFTFFCSQFDSIFQSNSQLQDIWLQFINSVNLTERNMKMLGVDHIDEFKSVLHKMDFLSSGRLLQVIKKLC